jgi:hypothetical protein
MTTATMHYRPFHAVPITSMRSFLRAINWIWWMQRAPMFLLAVPASYGVGAFTHERYPLVVAIIAGAGFEAAYLGAIAFADQQLRQDNWSKVLWWVLNVAAVSCSALINVLFAAGGMFSAIKAEDYVHGAPLAIINFLYALLLHRNATRAVAEDMQRAEDEKFKCGQCGRGFGNRNRLNGHKRHCKGAR